MWFGSSPFLTVCYFYYFNIYTLEYNVKHLTLSNELGHAPSSSAKTLIRRFRRRCCCSDVYCLSVNLVLVYPCHCPCRSFASDCQPLRSASRRCDVETHSPRLSPFGLSSVYTLIEIFS